MLMHDIAAFEVRKDNERKTRARIRPTQRRRLRRQTGGICSGSRRRMRMHPMRLQDHSCDWTALLFTEMSAMWNTYDKSLSALRPPTN